MLGVAMFAPEPGRAQTEDSQTPTAAEPAEGAPPGDVPPVEVEQPAPVEAAPPPKPRPRPRPVVEAPPPPPRPAAAPAPVVYTAPAPVTDVTVGPERGPDGRVLEATTGIGPNNPTSILPSDMSGYAGAGTTVTTQQIDEERPLTTPEALARVPGVSYVTDDGWGRHINLSIRGSSARRARKVLMMEDGQSINFSTYIDPSTHYTPPLDRIESIEVIRGGTVAYGPLNNFGVVNFRNLSPFGPEETVVSASFGNHSSNYRHAHTRQQVDNVGIVFSYTGMDADGVFDLERLGYNDFYGAVGWKGDNQDLTLSGLYFRQRDKYDERNLTLPGFLANPRCKKDHCMVDDEGELDFEAMGNKFNTYNADLWMGQILHNYYFDPDTTLSTRAYLYDQERARFESRYGGPRLSNLAESLIDGGVTGSMRGRDRHYQHYGAETKLELANRNFFGGMKQDIQMGIRTEYHELRNCNSAGRTGEILNWDNRGNCYAEEQWENDDFPPRPSRSDFRDNGQLENYDAMTYAGFIQSAVHLNDAVTVVPGVRFESWDLERKTLWNVDAIDAGVPLPSREKKDFDEVLPAINFAWGFGRIDQPVYDGKSLAAAPSRPRYHSTFYGGYHRGLGIPVARGEQIAALDPEIGDNFQIGLRSTAVRGFTFDGALFHSTIDDYQIKEAAVDSLGNNIFGSVDEVEIEGFELYSRFDSYAYWQPRFSGYGTNFFGEATYTYADSVISKGLDIDEDGVVVGSLNGNLVPEVPREFANLTAGIEIGEVFNASITWTYRGSFFTDVGNTREIELEGEAGKVPSVWLLSARANYNIPNTDYTLFVSGYNLEDKLYIADLSDGIKPGMGRTIMGGFKLKWGGGPRQAANEPPAAYTYGN